MYGKMNIAEIKAVLGNDTWVDEEDSSDVTYLCDKSIREGLTAGEQSHYDALIALYMSGR